MKHKSIRRIAALALSATLLAANLPMAALAAETGETLSMTEGDVKQKFVSAGTACTSTDQSVAWVDENGSLNALKPGTATITVPNGEGETSYTVTVDDFTDGSDVVGNLKILARYNDSMKFYDGHVYLLFTSYQDGVKVNVNDLYAGYEISDQYYTDIREDISNGSNHTGTDTDKYFTFSDSKKSVTLNRGEIVTIGMYRDFDLTVPQAALGSLKNSTAWTSLKLAGKTAVVETVFKFLDSGKLSTDEAVAKLKAVFEEIGMDYTKALDGVVDGGVCFNRELYNQKLEWDQYENVTYDLDITRNQLKTMAMSLQGNLNKFSILKNSCATVALRAWNAAVGTRNGEPTAYQLSSTGEGIFSIIDAPKTVRDNIKGRLPGYYLNNAEGVAEPEAGYQDDTGRVYVSAPKKVTPLSFNYIDSPVQVDEKQTSMTTLINAAKGKQTISYNKDEQQVDVTVMTSPKGQATSVNGIDFTINGQTVSVNDQNCPSGGIWFKTRIDDPQDGVDYYVVNAGGKVVPSNYADGWVSFYARRLPLSYRIVASNEGANNLLKTIIVNGDKAKATTEVYCKNGDEKTVLDGVTELNEGTKVYVKASVAADEYNYLPSDITMNGESIFNDANYDAEENAYFTTMPAEYSRLTVTYDKAVLNAKEKTAMQIAVGDTMALEDYAELMVGGNNVGSDKITWKIITNTSGAVELDGDQVKAVKAGDAILWACAEDNENIGVAYSVNVYENRDDMAAVTFSDDTAANCLMSAKYGEEDAVAVNYSGYLIKKGSVLTVEPLIAKGYAVMTMTANGKRINPGETVTVTDDTEIKVAPAKAQIKFMPKTVNLDAKGDTYKLCPVVMYSGVTALKPVYDPTITFESSDPMVTVDETGLITVAEDVPADGKAVIVTAYAGSSNKQVFATTKVILGDYTGSKIIGKITLSARAISKGELVAHGSFNFVSYNDIEMPVSYYHYFKPNDKYNDLMVDYRDHPENYTSDPALYSENELNLENRESYFDVYTYGEHSEPHTVSLKAGESFSVSNYCYDATNLITLKNSLENGSISSSAEAQVLVQQMKKYINGEEFDGEQTFDSLLATLIQMYTVTFMTGYNPADGEAEGGIAINREMYNQFRRNDTQFPNNYFAVEITADELETLKAFLANPDNNYYSLFTKNCGTGVVDLWNTVLADRPEYAVKANFTGVAIDPESLNIELGQMALNPCLKGESGKNFYPRTVAFADEVNNAIAKINSIGEVKYTPECKEKIDDARAAYNALSDSNKEKVWNYSTLTDAEKTYKKLKRTTKLLGDINGDGVINITDATDLQKFLAGMKLPYEFNYNVAYVNGDGQINISVVTTIQKYLTGSTANNNIGKPIEN